MKQNILGAILSFYRKKYNFSQVQLCEGICSKATLSRIEKGYNEIDSLTSECLLGRIGKEAARIEIILNDEDYKLWQMRQDIKKYLRDGENSKAKDLLDTYKKSTLENAQIHKQFSILYDAKIEMQSAFDKKRIGDNLFFALTITKPEFSLERVKENLYSPMEIEIVLLLVDLAYQDWKSYEMEQALIEIYKYVREVYSGRKKEEYITKVLMKLLELESKLLDDEKIIKYADEAINFLSQGREINNIAEIHFIKAKAMERYYSNKKSWKIISENCKKECYMAYVVYQLMNKKNKVNEIVKFCEDKLEWQIIKQAT